MARGCASGAEIAGIVVRRVCELEKEGPIAPRPSKEDRKLFRFILTIELILPTRGRRLKLLLLIYAFFIGNLNVAIDIVGEIAGTGSERAMDGHCHRQWHRREGKNCADHYKKRFDRCRRIALVFS